MKIKLPFKYNPTSWFLKGKEKEIAQAKYDLKGTALDKKIADINEKPFVTVLKTHFDPSNPKQGYFELDWNKHFVTNLKEHGFSGNSDEEIVDHWFSVLCNTIATEDTPMGRSTDEIVKRTVREDGKTEIS